MLGWLFKKPTKTVDDIFDKDDGLLTKTGRWINGLHFTPQERAELDKELVNAAAKFVESTLSENTERSKSRRQISKTWIKNHLFMIWLTIIVALLDVFLFLIDVTDGPTFSEPVFNITFSMLMTAGSLSVLGFFFGPYMLSQHLGINGKNKKPGKTNG